MQACESASAFLRAYLETAIAQHPALLLPVKPNPREYKSPAKVSSYSAQIFMTANPALNLSQQAVCLACDARSKGGVVPEEIRVAWQMLLRQIVQDGVLSGMESVFEVCIFWSNSASFEPILDLLWHAAPASPNGCVV